ncbi:hypothetical protein RQP46_005139 [Phenoliferia psychrophenolica]
MPIVQSDLDFLNSLSLDPTPQAPSSTSPNPSSTLPEFSPFSDLPTTATGELDLTALDEADVEDLLRRMEEAESAADGIESRLDGLLSTLDGMLGVLEEGEDDAGAVAEDEKLGEEVKVQPTGEVIGVDEGVDVKVAGAEGKA